MPGNGAAREKTLSHYGILATIFCIYAIAPTITSVAPALASIARAYPTVDAASIGYVVAITAIFQAVTAVFSGSVSGRLIGYRTVLVSASALYLISGCFPCFLEDGQAFWALLLSRAVFGISIGLMMPLSNALVMVYFQEEDKRAGALGIGNVMLNVGVIVTNVVAGFLCVISWQATFLVHVVGVVMLLLAFSFLRDPRFGKREKTGEDDHKGRDRLPMASIGFILLMLCMLVATQPYVVYNAQFITEAGMGNSVTAGIVTTVFCLAGMVASLSFKFLYRLIGNALVPLSFGLVIAGNLLGYLATAPQSASLILYGVGFILNGLGLLYVTCYVPLAITGVTPPSLVTFAMGLVTFATAGGTFLTTPFAQLAIALAHSGDLRASLVAGSVLAAVVLVMTCVWLILRKAKPAKA